MTRSAPTAALRLCALLLTLLLAAGFRAPAQQTGGFDATFRVTPGASSVPAGSYAPTADGKVLVAGQFTSYHGTARKGVARLGTDGAVDAGFDPGTGPGELVVVIPGVTTIRNPGYASHVAALPDARAVVAGSFSSWNGHPTKSLARLRSDGTVDTTFTSTLPAGGPLFALPDGRILVAGKAGDFGSNRKIGLVRINTDGTLDGSFGDAGVGAHTGLDLDLATVLQVARQADGKLLVLFGGLKGGQPAYGVGRLSADGALDTGFKSGLTTGLTSSLTGLGVDDNGRVLVSGSTPTFGGQAVGKVFRLTSTGALDSTFAFQPPATAATGLHVFGDGSALVTGTFTGVFGPVLRMKPDGTRDTTFGFTQTGAFGTLFVVVGNQPRVAPNGQAFVLASAFMVQSGGQLVQGNGPVRLTGGGGGGTLDAPAITSQPASVTAGVGSPASFTVTATGTAPLAYQWRHDGIALPGATGVTLSLAQVAESDAGDYSVVVSNLGGSVTSVVATLTVTRPPRFTSLPASPVLVAEGSPAALVAVADGPGTLRYQWYRNGTALTDATAATLTLAHPGPADLGAYEIEVTSEYGSARSPAIQVVIAPSAPAWFVTSTTDGPGEITDLWRDHPRGVVVAGTYGPAAAGAPEFTFGGVVFPRPAVLNGFVGRIDDAGAPGWMVPIVADLSHGLRVATYVAAAADGAGNVLIAGPVRGTGSVAGLALGAAGVEGTFIAKLDSTGKGLWAHLINGNLYERQLAVDGAGNAILTGRYTSDLVTQNRTLPAVAFGAAAVFKFGADGSLAWARHFQKAETVGGAVDIYNVTADAGGIYLAGTYDQSIRFGDFTERLPAPPYRAVGWLGKLDGNGAPQWLRAIGGSLPKDLARGPRESLWIIGQDDPPGGQVLHGYRTDGTFISRGVVARSATGGGSVLAAGVAVDAAERPIFGGHAHGIGAIGALQLGFGLNPLGMWAAAATPAGVAGTDAHLAGYVATPASGALLVSEFEASPAPDFYFAGAWTGVFTVNGRPATNVARKIFVTKTPGIPLPAVPAIVTHPTPMLYAAGDNRTLSCKATGGALVFRWLKNGQPIPETNFRVDTYPGTLPGETSSVITFLGLNEANAGDYTCEVSNALGTATSRAARAEAGSYPAIVAQPAPQRVNAGQPLTLSVTATGGNLTYEWYRNGAPIPGAPNSPTLEIPAAAADDGALYSVMVFNGLGSVTSSPARAIVCTGEPEPTFLGRPWVKILDDTITVPGTSTSLGLFARDDRPRFTLKDRTVHLVATAGAVNSLQPGSRALLRWRAGNLETLVWTNRLTPDGDRFTDCFYPTDETEGAMNFTAFSVDSGGQTRAGLYELRAGTLLERADDRTTLPTGSGRFLTWGSNVRRGATMIGYPGTFGDPTSAGSGIYAVDTAALRQLIPGNAVLPSTVVTGLGGLPSNFGLSFDGTHAIFAVADSSSPTRQAVFLADLAGHVTRLAQTGDPVPGQAGRTFTAFGAADLAGGAAYFAATDSARATWLVRAPAGQAQLQLLGSASLLAAAGPDLVYADAGSGLVGRYAGISDTPETVLPVNASLDCRRVTRVWQVDAEGDDVAVGVDLADGGVAVFVNVGTGPINPPAVIRLQAPTLEGDRLRFVVPTVVGKTYRVESTSSLGTASWESVLTVTGDGSAKPVEVPIAGGSRFYRIVEP